MRTASRRISCKEYIGYLGSFPDTFTLDPHSLAMNQIGIQDNTYIKLNGKPGANDAIFLKI